MEAMRVITRDEQTRWLQRPPFYQYRGKKEEPNPHPTHPFRLQPPSQPTYPVPPAHVPPHLCGHEQNNRMEEKAELIEQDCVLF